MSISKQEILISRLNEIGSSLAQSKKAVALIGLGSVGLEVDRLDDYSDLHFFAIVEAGFKNEFLDDLAWLAECDLPNFFFPFATLRTATKSCLRMASSASSRSSKRLSCGDIPFAPGRIVWKEAGVR